MRLATGANLRALGAAAALGAKRDSIFLLDLDRSEGLGINEGNERGKRRRRRGVRGGEVRGEVGWWIEMCCSSCFGVGWGSDFRTLSTTNAVGGRERALGAEKVVPAFSGRNNPGTAFFAAHGEISKILHE